MWGPLAAEGMRGLSRLGFTEGPDQEQTPVLIAQLRRQACELRRTGAVVSAHLPLITLFFLGGGGISVHPCPAL